MPETEEEKKKRASRQQADEPSLFEDGSGATTAVMDDPAESVNGTNVDIVSAMDRAREKEGFRDGVIAGGMEGNFQGVSAALKGGKALLAAEAQTGRAAAKVVLENVSAKNLVKGSLGMSTAVEQATIRETFKNAGVGVGMKTLGKRALGPVVAIGLGGMEAIKNFRYGQNIDGAGSVAGTGGAIAGGAMGAKGGAVVGAGIGAFFGGVGAAPGAVIGGIIGGVGGGIAGWFGGKAAGETIAEELGIENKYKDILSLKALSEQHANALKEKNITLTEAEQIADLRLSIVQLQDQGYAVINDVDSGFWAGQVGSTPLMESNYSDFNPTVSLQALQANIESLAAKQGKITDERYQAYVERFEKQIDALNAAGQFAAVRSADGTLMTGVDVKSGLMEQIRGANAEGINRETLLQSGAVAVIDKYVDARDAYNTLGVLGDDAVVVYFNGKYAQKNPGLEPPELTAEAIDQVKLSILKDNPNMVFAQMPAGWEAVPEVPQMKVEETIDMGDTKDVAMTSPGAGKTFKKPDAEKVAEPVALNTDSGVKKPKQKPVQEEEQNPIMAFINMVVGFITSIFGGGEKDGAGQGIVAALTGEDAKPKGKGGKGRGNDGIDLGDDLNEAMAAVKSLLGGNDKSHGGNNAQGHVRRSNGEREIS